MSSLVSEYRRIQKAGRRSSRRAYDAYIAYIESRNKKLREYASDQAKSRILWNVILHRIKEDRTRVACPRSFHE